MISGISSTTLLSKRPGRRSATSKISGLFVAAIIIILVFTSKPSISTRIWFNVCSRSSLDPPIPAPLCLPTASSSSINTIHGELLFAFLKRSRTRDAPTPTNISTNSDPEILKNGTSASPATALAKSVFPVPGAPTKRTPFGILAPNAMNFFGFFRKSTISKSSIFASLTPATSLNVILFFFSSGLTSRARLCPKLIALEFAPCTCLIIK